VRRSTARSRGEPFLSASLFLSPLHSATDTYSSLLSLSLRNSPAHRSRASLGALSFSDGIHSRLVEAPVSTSVDFVLIFYDPHDATSPCSPHSCSSLLTIGERLETDSKKKKGKGRLDQSVGGSTSPTTSSSSPRHVHVPICRLQVFPPSIGIEALLPHLHRRTTKLWTPGQHSFQRQSSSFFLCFLLLPKLTPSWWCSYSGDPGLPWPTEAPKPSSDSSTEPSSSASLLLSSLSSTSCSSPPSSPSLRSPRAPLLTLLLARSSQGEAGSFSIPSLYAHLSSPPC